MAHSYVEEKRLPLGLGDLYLNNVPVGQLKGVVTFHHKIQYAYQKPGNMISDVKAERMSEDVTLDAEVCELRPSQIRLALGINQALSTAAVALRKTQQMTLPSATAVTATETIVSGSVRVQKMDRSTVYVKGTDYTVGSNTITQIAAGHITANQTVIVEYDFSDSGSKSIQAGGELTAPNTFELDFVHELSDGKLIQITLYKAFSATDFSIAFNEKSSGKFTTYGVTFKALVDLTKASGKNLYQITEEDGPIN